MFDNIKKNSESLSQELEILNLMKDNNLEFNRPNQINFAKPVGKINLYGLFDYLIYEKIADYHQPSFQILKDILTKYPSFEQYKHLINSNKYNILNYDFFNPNSGRIGHYRADVDVFMHSPLKVGMIKETDGNLLNDILEKGVEFDYLYLYVDFESFNLSDDFIDLLENKLTPTYEETYIFNVMMIALSYKIKMVYNTPKLLAKFLGEEYAQQELEAKTNIIENNIKVQKELEEIRTLKKELEALKIDLQSRTRTNSIEEILDSEISEDKKKIKFSNCDQELIVTEKQIEEMRSLKTKVAQELIDFKNSSDRDKELLIRAKVLQVTEIVNHHINDIRDGLIHDLLGLNVKTDFLPEGLVVTMGEEDIKIKEE